MRVLVACEFSGVVRQAFARMGWDAWSCDLLPTEQPGKHIVGDALKAAKSQHWDLLIGHPPCQFLANSGVRWLYKGGLVDCKRWEGVKAGATFFRSLWDLNTPHMAIENPVMHGHANVEIFGEKRLPDCVIQPWMFGHGEVKATCLYLKNLPPLEPTKVVSGREPRVHMASPGPDRWKERSRTLTGIAEAMATQWTAHIWPDNILI